MNVNEMVYLTTARRLSAIEIYKAKVVIGQLRKIDPETQRDMIGLFDAIIAEQAYIHAINKRSQYRRWKRGK